MREEDKRKLGVHREKLLDDIADPNSVLDGLIARDLLKTQSDDYQYILAGGYVREQTRRLLDLLPRLGHGAFRAFVESVESYRPHLGDILRADLPPRGFVDSDSSGDSDDEDDLDRGPFPPAKPKDELACRLQLDLRRSYISLGERRAAVVDFGQHREGSGKGPTIADVCVSISSLNFDDVRAERALERSERLRSDGKADETSWRKELSSKTFASRCGDDEELDVGKIFRGADGKRVKSLLFVGPAGTGKSLLLERILECWSGGKVEILSKFDFAVYVSARDATALRSGTVAGMLVSALQRQIELSYAEKQALESYLKANARRVLVLVDSADEGGEAWEKSKALESLFERGGLPSCTFVVTSRPCPVAYDLVASCTRRFYLIGLNDRRLDELLVRRLGEENGRRLAAQLKEPHRQHVRELMKGTPLVADMIAKLAGSGATMLPTSTTQIYRAMALDMIHHELVKTDKKFAQGQVVSSFDDLPSEVQKTLAQLGDMALECLRQRRFVFDMKTWEQACGAEAIRLGFVDKFVVKATGGSVGSAHEVEFRHLTWLEFFAAHRLCPASTSPCGAVRSCAEQVGVEEDTEQFWKFVCGLVPPKQLEVVLTCLQTIFFERNPSELEKRQWEWLAMRCIAEAAQQSPESSSPDGRHLNVQKASANVLPDNVDMNNSRLSVADAHVLSAALHHSPHIKALNMMRCSMSADHYAAFGGGLTHVKEMNMFGNTGLHGGGLRALTGSLAQRSAVQLNELNLESCALNEEDSAAIEHLLHSVPSLRRLLLGLNHLGPQAVSRLQESLTKSKLELLGLRSVKLDSGTGQVLGAVCRGNQHLRALNVSDNDLGNDGARYLLSEVHCNPVLQALDLSRTSVNDGVLDAVSSCLLLRSNAQQEAHGAPVQRLVICLHGNNVSRDGLEEVARRMPADCQDRVECNSVTVKEGVVVERDYREFFTEFMRRGSKGDLVMQQHGLGDSGAEQTARLLRNDCNVHALDLDWNGIGDVGAASLATALEVNTTLGGLSLGYNRVGFAGVVSMATALMSSRNSLVFLNLGGNPLCSDSASADERRAAQEAVQRLLLASSGLRFLSLSNTGLGDAECKAIGEALASGECRLSFLRLARNAISDKGIGFLCSGLEQNSTIQYVDLAANKIGNDGVERIRRCVDVRSQQDRLPLHRVWLGGNSMDADTLTNGMVNSAFAYPPSPDMYTKVINFYC